MWIQWSFLRVWMLALVVAVTTLAPVMPVSAQEASGERVDPAEVTLTLVDPPRLLNYQGYLTNGSGAPFSGTLDMQARLFDSQTGGDLRFGPETFTGVSVQNGLFQLALGRTVQLSTEVFAQALWVEITINGAVLPRQPLRPAPYAFGLVPGARAVGTPYNSDYGLLVANLADTEDSTGIYARGGEVGVYATTASASGLGFFTPRAVEATGGYRGPDSIYFVSPLNGRTYENLDGSTLATNVPQNGSLLLRSYLGSCPCTNFFVVPIDVPAVLYGQNVTVKEVIVQYNTLRAENSTTAIRGVSVEKLVGLQQNFQLYSDTTTRNARTPAAFAIIPGNSQLDFTSGALTLRIEMSFANNTDFIQLGNIRVRLGHTP